MAPLAPPPGLESAGAAGAFGGPLGSLFGEAPAPSTSVPSTTSATRSVSSGSCDTPPLVDPALVESVRQAALSDIEGRVAERLQAVWQKGSVGLQKVQMEGEKTHSQLASSVAEFKVAQDAFEAENEKLKQTVASLVGRVAMLGGPMGPMSPLSPFGGVDLWSAMTSASSAPPTPSLDGSQAFHSGLPTPASASGRPDDLWGAAASLPAEGAQPAVDLPPFPFPAPAFGGAQEQAASTSPAAHPAPFNVAPLSLADALGIGNDPIQDPPPHSPVIPVGAPNTPPAAPPLSPLVPEFEDAAEPEVFVFGLSLRLAGGAELGLQLSAVDSAAGAGTLHVESVVPGGAAEAWNRQCGSSGAAEKVLMPGDRIVRVNDVGDDSQAMLSECESKRMLRLQVVRVSGGRTAASVPSAAAASPAKEPTVLASPSKLRAEASEWVPPAASPSPPSSPSKFNVDASVFVPKGIASAGPISGLHVPAAPAAVPRAVGPVAPGAVVTDGKAAPARPAVAAAPAQEASSEGGKRSRRAAARAGARARGAREM